MSLAEFDDAMDLLRNEKFYAAWELFGQLALHTADEEIVAICKNYRRLAWYELNRQVDWFIDEAEQYRQNNPTNFDIQRTCWLRVFEVYPDNPRAQSEVEKIDQELDYERILSDALAMKQAAETALERYDLPSMNRQLGAIQSLASENKYFALQTQIHELFMQIRQLRSDLRDRLSWPSTLAVTGHTREVYIRVRGFFSAGVPYMVDTIGLFGAPDAEVETEKLFNKARHFFITSLIRLADQRRELAYEQQHETPRLAIDTLKNALELLDDDILTAEDRDELKTTRQGVMWDLQRVEKRLEAYEQARQLVEQANRDGTTPQKRYELYIEAHEFFRLIAIWLNTLKIRWSYWKLN